MAAEITPSAVCITLVGGALALWGGYALHEASTLRDVLVAEVVRELRDTDARLDKLEADAIRSLEALEHVGAALERQRVRTDHLVREYLKLTGRTPTPAPDFPAPAPDP